MTDASAPAAAARPLPLWIDGDPGADDVQAILLALAHPERFDLKGISTVNGNVPIAVSTRNALGALALAGRPDIPVHPGADRPLKRAPASDNAFGETGLNGATLPDPISAPSPVDGRSALARAARAATPDNPLHIAALGPLTNIATLLRHEPDLADRIRVTAMGGAFTPWRDGARLGNITPEAEFNFHIDPEAAQIVATSLPQITIIPWETALRHAADQKASDRLSASGSEAGRIMGAMLHPDTPAGRLDALAGAPGPALCDPLVIAALLEPQLATVKQDAGALGIETRGEAAGRSRLHGSGPGARVDLVTGVDRRRVLDLLAEAGQILDRAPRPDPSLRQEPGATPPAPAPALPNARTRPGR